VAFIWFAVSVDDCNLYAVDEADCVGAYLAVVETLINPFNGRLVENPGRVLKGDPMPSDIRGVFSPGPT
jgi:hypothetical protein